MTWIVIGQTGGKQGTATEWVSCMLGEGGEKNYRDLFTEYLYVKTCAWSYEKEWRIPAPRRRPDESGLFCHYGFHPRELTATYLGPNCSHQDCPDPLAPPTHRPRQVPTHPMSFHLPPTPLAS